MTHKKRVAGTLARKPVDRPTAQFLYTEVGFYEHGEKLNDLFERYPGDFGPFMRREIPKPPVSAFGADGRYYQRITDEWGTTSEYRVYGIMGHAIDFPVKTREDADNFVFPPQPAHILKPALYRESVRETQNNYFAFGGTGGLFERMWLLRGFENFMMDLAEDSPEINALMDRLTEYYRAQVAAAVEAGADAIAFGDDYGTQNGLLVSRETFRRAVKPRLARMLEPARSKGMHVHFHSCGLVTELFEDFMDLGIGSVWPQLPLYEMRELKRMLDYFGLSIAIHTNRAGVMTSGTSEEVREAVLLENEIFKPKDGGAWFYIEVDTGFPFENVEALVETVYSL